MKHKIKLKLTTEVRERMDELKKISLAKDDAQLFQWAMAVYEFALKKYQTDEPVKWAGHPVHLRPTTKALSIFQED